MANGVDTARRDAELGAVADELDAAAKHPSPQYDPPTCANAMRGIATVARGLVDVRVTQTAHGDMMASTQETVNVIGAKVDKLCTAIQGKRVVSSINIGKDGRWGSFTGPQAIATFLVVSMVAVCGAVFLTEKGKTAELAVTVKDIAVVIEKFKGSSKDLTDHSHETTPTLPPKDEVTP